MKEILKFYETLCCTVTLVMLCLVAVVVTFANKYTKKRLDVKHINSDKYLNSCSYGRDSQRKQRADLTLKQTPSG